MIRIRNGARVKSRSIFMLNYLNFALIIDFSGQGVLGYLRGEDGF